jgi:hypothetical protein
LHQTGEERYVSRGIKQIKQAHAGAEQLRCGLADCHAACTGTDVCRLEVFLAENRAITLFPSPPGLAPAFGSVSALFAASVCKFTLHLQRTAESVFPAQENGPLGGVDKKFVGSWYRPELDSP